ncbi:MAG: peptidoglycan-binding domain-containing protein [Chthoniobacterales bacterium]
MKKLLTIMISCTLALAASALAQQDEASPADQKKQKAEQRATQGENPGADQARPGRQGRPDRQAQQGNEAKPTQNRKAMRQERAAQDASAPTDPATKPMSKKAMKREEAATEDTTTAATEADEKGMRRGKQMKKERNAADETATAETGTTATEADKKGMRRDKQMKKEKNAANETATDTSASTETAPAAGAKRMGKGKGKKPDAQVVAKVKSEQANFKAQPKPEKVPAVTFQQNYRLTNADTWQGPQYEVFRSYRPELHDRSWYSTRYTRIEIIAGGAYYFNNGYWFPAWGYNSSAQYYAYNAPIYVGSRALPPDRVIAEVQAILQQEGYYRGEVDGLLGPLTREALIGYQTDNGLYATATIDEPTLVSLNLG